MVLIACGGVTSKPIGRTFIYGFTLRRWWLWIASLSPLYLPPFSSVPVSQLQNHFDHSALLPFRPLSPCILKCEMDGHDRFIHPCIFSSLSSPNPSLIYFLHGESRRCLPFIIYFHLFVQLLSAVTHVHTYRHTHMNTFGVYPLSPSYGFILVKEQ